MVAMRKVFDGRLLNGFNVTKIRIDRVESRVTGTIVSSKSRSQNFLVKLYRLVVKIAAVWKVRSGW
jgi:hypothetical protein